MPNNQIVVLNDISKETMTVQCSPDNAWYALEKAACKFGKFSRSAIYAFDQDRELYFVRASKHGVNITVRMRIITSE